MQKNVLLMVCLSVLDILRSIRKVRVRQTCAMNYTNELMKCPTLTLNMPHNRYAKQCATQGVFFFSVMLRNNCKVRVNQEGGMKHINNFIESQSTGT